MGEAFRFSLGQESEERLDCVCCVREGEGNASEWRL